MSSLSSAPAGAGKPTSTSPSFLDKLPYELYLEILDRISEPPKSMNDFRKRSRDVAAFSLVCRSMKESGQQSLYSDVCFSTLAELKCWLRMGPHYAVRSIRFGQFDTFNEIMLMGEERGELMVDVIRKSPEVQRLIFDTCGRRMDDASLVNFAALQLPCLEYLSVTDTNLFSAPTSTPSFPSLLYLDWIMDYDNHTGLNNVLASSPALLTLRTNSLPSFELIPYTLRDLTLNSALESVPSEWSRLINLRRLSFCVASTRELLEILSAIASKLDYLAVRMLSESNPDNTEDCMLACLKVESMKELRKLDLQGLHVAFNSTSLHAFGDECVRRDIQVYVMKRVGRINEHEYLNNPPITPGYP